MCGRFTLFESDTILSKEFGAPIPFALSPRYNIAPSQPILAVRAVHLTGRREFTRFRWGFIPSWSKDPSIGYKMINARSETAPDKPSFRDAFKRRRCLIPANGFYEWQRQERKKQPFYIRMRNKQPFAFAGLWERWEAPDSEAIETCAILTTAANDILKPLHERMPVIISPAAYEHWLNAGDNPADRDSVLSMLRHNPAGEMEAFPVGTVVNNPKMDDPRCIAPAG